jgi:hypothetical protein
LALKWYWLSVYFVRGAGESRFQLLEGHKAVFVRKRKPDSKKVTCGHQLPAPVSGKITGNWPIFQFPYGHKDASQKTGNKAASEIGTQFEVKLVWNLLGWLRKETTRLLVDSSFVSQPVTHVTKKLWKWWKLRLFAKGPYSSSLHSSSDPIYRVCFLNGNVSIGQYAHAWVTSHHFIACESGRVRMDQFSHVDMWPAAVWILGPKRTRQLYP